MSSITYLLRNFQFTESEAKVYVSLLESGPCTGYEASKNSGVARSKIYNVLESLLQRGVLFSTFDGKNRLYCAESISHLTEVIRAKTEENLAALERESACLTPNSEDEQIWRIYDSAAVKAQCMQMIQSAKEHIVMQIWMDDLSPRLEEAIIAKQKELGRVAVVLYDAREQYETKIPSYYRHGFERDKIEEQGGRWTMIEVDNREMLYVAYSGAEMGEAFHTHSRYMALFAKEYIYHDAYCLRLITRLKEQVKSEFGFDMEGVRDIFSLKQ